MTAHVLAHSPSGLWSAYYMDRAENVTIRADTAKSWKYVIDEDATLSHFLEIAEAFSAKATSADLIWLANTLASVETWLEMCPHDLATYGMIGVSY